MIKEKRKIAENYSRIRATGVVVGQCRTSGEMSHGKKEEAENEDKGILKVFLFFYQAAATTELLLKLDNVRSVYSGTHIDTH